MFDGRYNNDNPRENTGVPIEIFHNSFAEFQHDAEHVDLPSTKVMVNVIDLFDKSSAIYENEAQRLAALRPCLESILGISLSRVENADLTKPHATNFIDVPTNAEGSISRAVALIWEGKDEFGRGGSSPDVQAAQAVRRTWFQLASVLAGNRCCCPTFLLATGGPYIMVLGVVITQTVVVRRLTPWLPMVNVSYDLRPYEQVARVLVALKNSVSRLTQFWNGLPLPRDPQVPAPSRFHPWRTSYQTTNDHEVHFEYLHPLETDPSTVTFLARHVAGDKDLIVVKFVMADRYGEEAHNLLASKGYAPPLLYRGRLSRSCHWLSMVVMGYVDGHSLSDKLPITSVRSQIEAALRFMHEENFVFGDLRLQNVMVDSQQQVKLIDLDWAGIAGEARYPLRMNVHGGIRWARGMAPGELILKEHDWEMLDNMGLI
ncbi:hypothetical protein DL96DRAFT_1520667 [Flagelloscypha sp. PMI_526]|nr:hypothetical protein DL96DRAFT_1520667 [Flagelloscypha sp. PMI_526]